MCHPARSLLRPHPASRESSRSGSASAHPTPPPRSTLLNVLMRQAFLPAQVSARPRAQYLSTTETAADICLLKDLSLRSVEQLLSAGRTHAPSSIAPPAVRRHRMEQRDFAGGIHWPPRPLGMESGARVSLGGDASAFVQLDAVVDDANGTASDPAATHASGGASPLAAALRATPSPATTALSGLAASS